MLKGILTTLLSLQILGSNVTPLAEFNSIREIYTIAEIMSNIQTEQVELQEEHIEVEDGESPSVGYWTVAEITHYCSCYLCCDVETGITASGTYATAGRTIAMSSDYEFGTQVEINGQIYIVEDRGGAIGYTYDGVPLIDLYVNSHSEALRLGRYRTDIFIYY